MIIENIKQHFRPEEQAFLRKINDWIKAVEDYNYLYLTDFLNPREQFILKTIVNSYDNLTLHFDGGFLDAENKKAIIAPDFLAIEKDNFEIALLEIKYPSKFLDIYHSSILGSMLSLGINRSKLGDIVAKEKDGQTHWYIALDQSLVDFLQTNFKQVGKAKISLEQIKNPKDLTLNQINNYQNQFLLLDSLRIDAIISKVYGLSRNEAKELIEKEKITLNWCKINKSSTIITNGDLISVRGYGRIKMLSVDGYTRKNKMKVVVDVIRKK